MRHRFVFWINSCNSVKEALATYQSFFDFIKDCPHQRLSSIKGHPSTREISLKDCLLLIVVFYQKKGRGSCGMEKRAKSDKNHQSFNLFGMRGTLPLYRGGISSMPRGDDSRPEKNVAAQLFASFLACFLWFWLWPILIFPVHFLGWKSNQTTIRNKNTITPIMQLGLRSKLHA